MQRVTASRLSPTERRNPRSMGLDKMSVRAAIKVMLSEEAKVPGRLLKHAKEIEKAIDLIVRALKAGGRLLYVGAGTSGRLGVLDASECPPTFRTRPEMVQGIVAGGRNALWQSIEGAEDDAAAGAKEIKTHRVRASDAVVGIAASGTTPFVWGALREAQEAGVPTILVCFNPYLEIPKALRPKVVIAVDLGPEVLTGSTRLKAGTATKLLLNMFTTLAMVRLGKVMSNLMIDVNPANTKLRQRATRIVSQLTGRGEAEVRGALERNAWNVRKAAGELLNQRAG